MKKFVLALLVLLLTVSACCFSEESLSNAEPIRVNPGYYIVGEDFEAGSYDIYIVCETEDDKDKAYLFVWQDSDSFFAKKENSSFSMSIRGDNIGHINLHDGNVLVSDTNIPAKLDFVKTR